MNVQNLEQFGLTKAQARAYITLVKHGSLTASQTAARIDERRTNTYMILEKLDELGLILKNTDHKVATFFPANPIQLQILVEKRRKEVIENEQAVKNSMPALLNYYYSYQHTPGIRFFQGKSGIAEMLDDQLRTGEEVHFLRSDADTTMLGDVIYQHVERRAKLNIRSYGIEVDSKEHRLFALQDKRLKRSMTWLPKGVFDVPVSIYIYGNKVGIISFGEEAIGTIIESPQLAVAFKQIMNIIRISAPTFWKAQRAKGAVTELFSKLPNAHYK